MFKYSGDAEQGKQTDNGLLARHGVVPFFFSKPFFRQVPKNVAVSLFSTKNQHAIACGTY